MGLPGAPSTAAANGPYSPGASSTTSPGRAPAASAVSVSGVARTTRGRAAARGTGRVLARNVFSAAPPSGSLSFSRISYSVSGRRSKMLPECRFAQWKIGRVPTLLPAGTRRSGMARRQAASPARRYSTSTRPFSLASPSIVHSIARFVMVG